MLGPAYSKKPHDVFYFVFLCFIAWERMDEQWPIQAYLWKIMVHLTGMFMKTTVCKDKYPSKSVLNVHGHKKGHVKSVLQECQLFSIGRGKACSSMSRQLYPGLLSLDSRGYMALKRTKIGFAIKEQTTSWRGRYNDFLGKCRHIVSSKEQRFSEEGRGYSVRTKHYLPTNFVIKAHSLL